MAEKTENSMQQVRNNKYLLKKSFSVQHLTSCHKIILTEGRLRAVHISHMMRGLYFGGSEMVFDIVCEQPS